MELNRQRSWGAGSGNNPNMADSNYNFGYLMNITTEELTVLGLVILPDHPTGYRRQPTA